MTSVDESVKMVKAFQNGGEHCLSVHMKNSAEVCVCVCARRQNLISAVLLMNLILQTTLRTWPADP